MRMIKNIAALLLCVIFVATSSGIVIYQSHCSCTGNEQFSFYVTPETCEDELENHSHHSHCDIPGKTTCGLNECGIPSEACGCESMQVSYLKLEDQVVKEKSRQNVFQPVQVELPLQITKSWLPVYGEPELFPEEYEDRPPKTNTSTDYLIFIQQLKIPASA